MSWSRIFFSPSPATLLAEEKKGLPKTPCCWDGKKEKTGSSFFFFSSPVTFSVCKIPMLALE
jgi:hypothetical protein